ncbi:putative 2,3-bisphosphoglycerate-dependent phosphoglycerate mutase [Gordonia effusa NBRC 100432]|uniref:Putative 2,3-bisphosphoglycerate-dependent phosphoglycerate mutase n=1 Tax=Gordonia effusa NBRC 100432 TaxID=1077974 RepID=H0QVG9_9ACTN|nr:histidine phosphatase family protein [Gordonia effusa]GAB16846.1 putative 2,3-bisphosphoglycerate-dependent phosphoglycerate mutase [Gordonia effusa NBRC 100432]
MSRLFLVRHGETTSNVMRRLDTRLPGAGLTDFGARQAALFALRTPVDDSVVLLNSRARRAQQTAEIAGMVWGIEPQPLDGVYEVQVGDLEDNFDRASHDVFGEVVKRWHDGDLTAELPGGESLQDVYDRYLPAIDDVVARYLSDDADRDVYVVSHGAAIRLVAAKLAGIDSEFALANHLENTQSIELEYADGTWACRRWGTRVAPFAHEANEGSDDADPMG